MAACSSGGGAPNPGRDQSVGTDTDLGTDTGTDGGSGGKGDMAGRDMTGSGGDGGMSGGDMAGGPDLPCMAGAYRCAVGNAIEICNSTGTAWLHSATCAVSCAAGLCTGACTAGVRRCNMNSVEECNTAGTTWNKVDTCAGSCSSGSCALASLDITKNQNLDGELYVDGDVFVRSGVTVTSPTGSLTIHAKNITVENMGTITAAATGNPYGWGNGGVPTGYSYAAGAGGGNGSAGGNDPAGYATGGQAIGSATDLMVFGGGSGGAGYAGYGGAGGSGGGAIRLMAADSITIAGFLTANGTAGAPKISSQGGGGGGGAGGGILLAASGSVTISGAISAAGGGGGAGYYYSGGVGGQGRVKILAGDKRTITGTITGARTDGLLPPVTITSSSHPDPTLIYNDNFDKVEMSWVSPFASRQGYYHMINTANYAVPTPGSAAFINTESKSYPSTAVGAGRNFFHVTPVDAMTTVGTVENNFMIQINSTPPSVSSSSHSSPSSWYPGHDPFFSWSLPVADQNVKGVYYVFDNYGDTVPTKSDTFVPLPQKNLMRSAVTSGIWFLHVVALDQRGYLTRAAGHFRVNIGDDPGNGVVLGQVTDAMGKALPNATVSINRGLFSLVTNSSGNYNFPTVPAGTYELRVTVAGKAPSTQMIMVAKGGSTTANVSIP